MHMTAKLVTCLLKNKGLNLNEAGNELRWMIERIKHKRKPDHQTPNSVDTKRILYKGLNEREIEKLTRWCTDRGVRNKPLQYILQSQPFGSLSIICRRPVLIPRVETEIWVQDEVDRLLMLLQVSYSVK
jgi:methylase of polypeptide subunit release factors